MKTSLIEKEGKFYKECGVVMLGTIESICDCKPSIDGITYHLYQCGLVLQNSKLYLNGNSVNLYITSDDEIKDGDWCVVGDHISKYNSETTSKEELKAQWRKIIATTDKLLIGIDWMNNQAGEYDKTGYLPQPSDKFIQAFIEAYNKSEKIEKVLVEWGNGCHCCEGSIETCNQIQSKGHSLKVDCDTFRQPILKGNNIIIKKMKDSWSREEVHSLMMQAWINGEADKSMDYTVREKWIEENL